MKTKEELNTLKEEVETVSRKLNELSEEELERVAGGGFRVLPEPVPGSVALETDRKMQNII